MKKIILTILFIVVFMSGRELTQIYINYEKANTYYMETQNQYIETTTATPTQIAEQEVKNAIPEKGEKKVSKATKSLPKQVVRAHTTTLRPPITIDFSALKQINQDVIGWIYSADSPINYPILHTTNNSQYIHRLMNGEYSVNGSIFLDSQCASNFSNDNSILYGHHMRNGSMFASLAKYKEQEYYNSHSQLWLLTPEKNYLIIPFSGMVVHTNNNCYQNVIKNKEEFIDQALRKSTFIPIAAPNVADRIITLSTCDYTFDNARYVVLGILIPCN